MAGMFDTAMNAAKSAYASWNAPSAADTAKAKAAAEAAARQAHEQVQAERKERRTGMERDQQLWGAEWERVSADLENVLDTEDAQVDVVNVGDPEVKGFQREIVGDRALVKEKKRCEDRKINDPEHGLFAVMDGVSTAAGEYKGAGAAEITSRVVQSRMGERLDEALRNLQASGESSENKIHEVVVAAMRDTVSASQRAVEKAQKTMPDRYGGTNTTLSLAKLIDMPDGGARMYFTNIGDSRVYVQDGDQLIQLTEDDSQLNHMIESGQEEVSPEELEQIDQFVSEEHLTKAQKYYANMRNRISESIGMVYSGKNGTGRKSNQELRFDPQNLKQSDIRFVDLKPGQRIVITSDGVHDNSLRSEIKAALSSPDTRSAERRLQSDARATQEDTGKDWKTRGGRGKPDDIAAVVAEVPVRRERAAEAAPKGPEQKQEKRSYTPEQAKQWPSELKEIDGEIKDLDREIADLQRRGDSVELAKAQRDRNALEQQRAQYEYWIARANADSVADRLPSHAGERPDQAQPRVGDVIRHRRTLADNMHQFIEAKVLGAKPETGSFTVQFESKNERGEPQVNIIDVDADDLTDSLNIDLTRGVNAQLEMPKKLAAFEKLKQEAVALRQNVEQAQTAKALEAQRAKMGLSSEPQRGVVESQGRWSRPDRAGRRVEAAPVRAEQKAEAPASSSEAALLEAYDALSDEVATNVREGKTILTGEPAADVKVYRDQYRLSRMEALRRAPSGAEKDQGIDQMMEEFDVEKSWEDEDLSDDEADILVRYYKAKQTMAQEKERLALGSAVGLSKEDQRKVLLARSAAGETEKVLRMMPGPERTSAATALLARLKARG